MAWWQILLIVLGGAAAWFALSAVLYRPIFKRFYDILLSGMALILLSPIFLVFTIAIRVKLGSPVMFKQRRPGKNGKVFYLHKFRTMTDARGEDGELLPDEARMTRFGAFLRSTSIDELPEIWDIFRGKMSIIGPRPLLEKYLDRYTEEQAHRHDVRPGLTGLAQVSGRNAISWEKKFELDVKYVRTYNIFTDISIFFKTVGKVFKREGISEAGAATMGEFKPDGAKQSLPLISVIVPVYNIADYVADCLSSIIGQTYTELEIIAVDDGSTDGSGEICDGFAQKDSRVKVIHKPNGGLVSARKAGLAAAHGEYIGYVDGDDWIEPGFYAALYGAIKDTDCDMAAAGFKRDIFDKSVVFLNGAPCGTYTGEKLAALLPHAITDVSIYRPHIYTYLWNKLFRRAALEDRQNAVPDGISVGEDAAVVFPMLFTCGGISITDDCSYRYRQHERSMLKVADGLDGRGEGIRLLSEYLQGVPGLKDNADYVRQVGDYLLSVYLVHSGGRIDGEFVYPSELDGKRIALYSAGTFGQQIYRRSGPEIVIWLDDDCAEYRESGLNVSPVEDIADADYDCVLIATANGALAADVAKRLEALGVAADKILTYDMTDAQKKETAARYEKYLGVKR